MVISSRDDAFAGADLEMGAAQRVEQLWQRRPIADRQAQRTEPLANRRLGVIGNPVDAAVSQIKHSQRIHHVVELRAGEVDADRFVPANLPEMFEVADAVLVQYDSTDRQRSRRRWSRCGRARLRNRRLSVSDLKTDDKTR